MTYLFRDTLCTAYDRINSSSSAEEDGENGRPEDRERGTSGCRLFITFTTNTGRVTEWQRALCITPAARRQMAIVWTRNVGSNGCPSGPLFSAFPGQHYCAGRASSRSSSPVSRRPLAFPKYEITSVHAARAETGRPPNKPFVIYNCEGNVFSRRGAGGIKNMEIRRTKRDVIPVFNGTGDVFSGY